MRAAVHERYGPPEVVHVVDAEIPWPKDNEVLVKVHAASINPLDCVKPSGGARLVTGLLKPKDRRLGIDVAGEVEAVGRAVTNFKPGNKIFGACIRDANGKGIHAWDCQGAFAEYVCVPDSMVALKPDSLTFAEAACVPVASFTALQGLRDKGRIQAGKSVLVNGASGGVGTFAVQIAKSFGALVTGVCGTSNLELVRSIGADRVIDYAEEDFTRCGERYDLIFDCVGNRSLSDCVSALNPGGIHVMVGDMMGRGAIGYIGRLGSAFVRSRFATRKTVAYLAKPVKEDLITICNLIRDGKVRPVVDRSYRLQDLADAIRYLEGRRARGKVVITAP